MRFGLEMSVVNMPHPRVRRSFKRIGSGTWGLRPLRPATHSLSSLHLEKYRDTDFRLSRGYDAVEPLTSFAAQPTINVRNWFLDSCDEPRWNTVCVWR